MANAEAYKTEIKRTFALVQPISTQAAAIFYPTLWEVNPATKPLFKNTDMDKQGEKLMKTLGIAVAMLNKMDTLVPILQHLGRKHVSYGVKAEMYSSVREALLITLEKGLGGVDVGTRSNIWRLHRGSKGGGPRVRCSTGRYGYA